MAKKNPNSVASFVSEVLGKKLHEFPQLKKIVLLSDAAGGQNKNTTMTRFCSFFARLHNIEITHLFPVRGHSFGQCDRNFGLMKTRIKRLATVETPMIYLTEMVQCRSHPSPFEVLFDREVIRNWETGLHNCFKKSPTCKMETFKIQSYVWITYKTDGTLLCSPHYNWSLSSPFQLWNQQYSHECLQDIYANLESVPYNPVTPKKADDVTALFKYISEKSRAFIENLFEESGTNAGGCIVSVPVNHEENHLEAPMQKKRGRPKKRH